MDPKPKAGFLALAAAIALNDELTILLGGIQECTGDLDTDDPLQPTLLDMAKSAERVRQVAFLLARYAAKEKARLVAPIRLEKLIG